MQHSIPQVVISLDFEMRWGVHDVYGLDFNGYRENIEKGCVAVPALLDMFQRYDIRATWAAVGALGCATWEEYFRRAPPTPKYKQAELAIRREYADLDPDGALHFAPDLMQRIAATEGQELGAHTFSHLYLREPGITAEDVAADLRATCELYVERFGTPPRSLVFPRNQPAFLDVVRASSVKVWRGNPRPWYYECEDTEHNGPMPRGLKLIDSVNPFSKRAAPQEGDMTRASLFLRLSLQEPLWTAHVFKIERELDGLEPGDIFHLWFHPDNLGQDSDLRLSRVRQILELIAERRERGELVSRSMGDLTLQL